MSLDPQWLYWAITISFSIVWCVLFAFSPHWRRAQLRVSAVFAIVGIAVENIFYFKDYWHPPASIQISLGSILIYPEFLFFGAAFAGIALVIYPALFGFTFEKTLQNQTMLRVGAGCTVFVIVSCALWYVGLNSIYATAVGAFALMLFISSQRRDLFKPALISGVCVAITMFILYSIIIAFIANLEEVYSTIWYLYGTRLDIRLFSVPLTELVWGFSVGSAIGAFYMYVRGARYVRM